VTGTNAPGYGVVEISANGTGIYLVKRYVPSLERRELMAAASRLEELSAGDVHHVTTVVISGEDMCISIIEAPDFVAVESLTNARGRVRSHRGGHPDPLIP